MTTFLRGRVVFWATGATALLATACARVLPSHSKPTLEQIVTTAPEALSEQSAQMPAPLPELRFGFEGFSKDEQLFFESATSDEADQCIRLISMRHELLKREFKIDERLESLRGLKIEFDRLLASLRSRAKDQGLFSREKLFEVISLMRAQDTDHTLQTEIPQELIDVMTAVRAIMDSIVQVQFAQIAKSPGSGWTVKSMSDFQGPDSERFMTWIELSRSSPDTIDNAQHERLYYKSDLLARGTDAFQFRSYARVPKANLSDDVLKAFWPLQKMAGAELSIEATAHLNPFAHPKDTLQFLIPESSVRLNRLTVYSVEQLMRQSLIKTDQARCVGFLKSQPFEPSIYYNSKSQ